MGTLDETMPALFVPATSPGTTITPVAQLGAGPDGSGLAIAAFEHPGAALAAALEIQGSVDEHALTTGLACRVAVHRGPMMALTQAGRLDYFGEHVELALEAAAATPPAAISITQSVCADVEIADRVLALPDRIGMAQLGSWWMWQLRARRSSARVLTA